MKKCLKMIIFVFIIVLITNLHCSCFAITNLENDTLSDNNIVQERVYTKVGDNKKKNNNKKNNNKKNNNKKNNNKKNNNKKNNNKKNNNKKNNKESDTTETVKTIDTSITSDQFVSDLDPNKVSDEPKSMSTTVINFLQKIIKPVLGIIQAIGGFIMIVSLGIYGYGLLLSGNNDLAKELGIKNPHNVVGIKDFGRSILIGSVLLFFSTIIVKFVFQIFNI